MCDGCGKAFRLGAKAIWHVPSNVAIQLGVDRVKRFHPACHRKAYPGVKAV